MILPCLYDTYITETSPDSDYSEEGFMYLGLNNSNARSHILLRFFIHQFPDVISKANLRLKCRVPTQVEALFRIFLINPFEDKSVWSSYHEEIIHGPTGPFELALTDDFFLYDIKSLIEFAKVHNLHHFNLLLKPDSQVNSICNYATNEQVEDDNWKPKIFIPSLNQN